MSELDALLDEEAGPDTLVLGIETSCDETAAALVMGGGDIVSSVVSSQIDLHVPYGGVVPEIASRAHVELVVPVIARAVVEAGIEDARIDAVAATVGPGLIGALLVGVSTAKALALVWDVPFVGVNHLEAHLYAALLEDPDLVLPVVVLLVSMEGHGQYRLLGQTIDDAAGEAFDKVARYLGLGYPGGPAIDRDARRGDPDAIRFPRAMLDDGLDFSFSGLKTAVVNHVRRHPEVETADVAASFQRAVVDVLVTKARRAATEVGATAIALGGGVAANSVLRERFLDACAVDGLHAFVPSRAMCTDNAAMVTTAPSTSSRVSRRTAVTAPVGAGWGRRRDRAAWGRRCGGGASRWPRSSPRCPCTWTGSGGRRAGRRRRTP